MRPSRSPRARAALAGAALAVIGSLATGCGGELDVATEDRQIGTLFYERCSGCHSLDSANSFGSKPKGKLAGGERTNGPNFNVRAVARDDALYAIRNGGFSGAIMPANIVVGQDAERMADFLEKYAGKERGGEEELSNPDENE